MLTKLTCGSYFAIYTNIKALCCTNKTNTMLHINYISILLKANEEEIIFLPWRRKWQPTPVFLPGEFHGQRSLASYSPWGDT